MRADGENAASFALRALEMLEPFDPDEAAQPLERHEPRDAELDDRHADRVEMSAQQPPVLLRGQLGETRAEIDRGDPPAASRQDPQNRADHAAQRELHRIGQMRRHLEAREQQPRGPIARAAEPGQGEIGAVRAHAAVRDRA